MTLIEKLFALKEHPYFRPVEDSELILIAEVAVARQIPPGTVIVPEGAFLNRLLVVVSGSVYADPSGEPAPPLIGIESLVMEQPLAETLIAAPDSGVTCLMIAKGHFFTVINECPEILVHYLEQGRRPESPNAAPLR